MSTRERRDRSNESDRFLSKLFHDAVRTHCDADTGKEIALAAVGGYGRQELLPNSDIDLLILLERNNQSAHRDNIQSFTTLLWDIGLEVGHSVRSIAECKPSALHDVTILTAMMESRTILGDDALCEKVQQKMKPPKKSPDWA